METFEIRLIEESDNIRKIIVNSFVLFTIATVNLKKQRILYCSNPFFKNQIEEEFFNDDYYLEKIIKSYNLEVLDVNKKDCSLLVCKK